jgi:glycosyltransferase involved in cell wall biosynthesis
MVPFDHPGELAQRLIHLLDHPEQARRMGDAARDRALDFSAKDFPRRIVSTLHSVVDDSHS